MSARPVLPYPHLLLKSESKPIPEFTDHARKLLESLFRDMADTVEIADGRGLSAIQIGAPWRVIYISKLIAGEPLYIVNPIIAYRGELLQHFVEGCMSCPGIDIDIQRSASIRVVGRRANGDDMSVSAGGLLAQALQHEINHLDGKTIVDCANPAKRRFYTDKLRQECRGHQGMLLDYATPILH